MRILLVLLAFGSLLAAGCGGGSNSSSSSSGSSDSTFAAVPTSERSGKVLTIFGFGTGDDVAVNRTKLAKQAIAPAALKNPNGSYDPQRFLTQLAAGNVPDLVYVDPPPIRAPAGQGGPPPPQGRLHPPPHHKLVFPQGGGAEGGLARQGL